MKIKLCATITLATFLFACAVIYGSIVAVVSLIFLMVYVADGSDILR